MATSAVSGSTGSAGTASTLSTRAALTNSARLQQLRAAHRKPGEASFFYFDNHFRNEAVKVLPGEFFVHDEDILIMTTLGSCIAACIWDRDRKVGGMNHFLLPLWNGEGLAAPRFGNVAIEKLLARMGERAFGRGLYLRAA